MKKKYTVEVDDENEVLIKFNIDKKSLDNFLGRTIQTTNYVCGAPMDNNQNLTDSQRDELVDAMIEDSVYSALNEPSCEATYEVLVSPVKKEKYINGEYQEILDTYICKSIFKELGKFVEL